MKGNKEQTEEVKRLMGLGLSRRTAYYRLKGKIVHCPTCSCSALNGSVTKEKVEKVDNEPGGFKMADLSRIEASPKFEFCHIHKGAYKGSCGC